MPGFVINEGSLQMPEGWEDKSITALSFPKGAPVPSASVTVTREVLPDSKIALPAYIETQLTKLAKTCAAFHLTERRDWELQGDPAQVLDFTWKTPDGVHVRQLMVILFWNLQSLVFTYTSTIDKFTEFQPTFQNIIASFRVRR